MLSGNRGEWSEIYTFLKLLSDGKLFAADEQLNINEEIFYPIKSVIRSQQGVEYEYERDNYKNTVTCSLNSNVREKPISEYEVGSVELLEQIKKVENRKGSFKIPSLDDYLSSLEITTLKASSVDKSDINIVVHDYHTGTQHRLGFSIKSKLGSPSTLFNASKATNFLYKIEGGKLSPEQIAIVNGTGVDSKISIKEKMKLLDEWGYRLSFYDIEHNIFKLNLQLIDSKLPNILSQMLLYYYKGKPNKFIDILKLIEMDNPCSFNCGEGHYFYRYKVKNFLTDIALGMTPAKVWNGKYDATGGYIIVREDGEVLCYHIYNRNEFQEYLLSNTKFDTPSTSRHEFGTVFEENGEFFIRLNMQIRFL